VTPLVAVVLAALGVLAWLIATPLLRARRRAARMMQPLDHDARLAIARNVSATRRLPPELRERLEALVAAFVAEKEFIGCNGLRVTAEMRVTIAALASLLVLGRRGHYDRLHSILVYPTAFWVEDEIEDEAGVVTRRRRVLSGESWDSSRIILSWEDVREAARYPGEGYNVALHEFAHYLDAEGLGLAVPPRLSLTEAEVPTPAVGDHDQPGDRQVRPVKAWGDDLAREFDALLDAVERGEETLLDPYATEDEAEFFAVATEEFFERPRQLRAAHPRLYGLLWEFYALDPMGWAEA
jgi:Mlc titration factor MtfA (ptsG expression regulator)